MCLNSKLFFVLIAQHRWLIFLLLYGRHVVGVSAPWKGTNMALPTWRPHRKLYKLGWNTFRNNAGMKNRTGLNRGEVVYISVIFHIIDSWLISLNVCDIYFWLRDSANRNWTLKFLLCRTTGLYTKTLARIIYRDITRFSVVLVIVFIGFSGAMYMALKATDSQELFR